MEYPIPEKRRELIEWPSGLRAIRASWTLTPDGRLHEIWQIERPESKWHNVTIAWWEPQV